MAAENVDPHNLNRFVEAQEPIYNQALAELKSGRKRSHWMWFIFPQIDGLGLSTTAKQYSIKNLREAEAYLKHPVLGKRLLECCEAILSVQKKSAFEILGSPDDLKLCSCVTLFGCVSEAGSLFERVLEKYYLGKQDENTLRLIRKTT